jgi:hypothetical protein
VETTAEDINFSGNFRERRGCKARRHFRFLFAYEDCAPGARDCQAEIGKGVAQFAGSDEEAASLRSADSRGGCPHMSISANCATTLTFPPANTRLLTLASPIRLSQTAQRSGADAIQC